MSETGLARWTCMPQPYLNAISCGKKNTTIKQLERIAEALGMPPTAGHFITAQSLWTSSSKVSLLMARLLTAER